MKKIVFVLLLAGFIVAILFLSRSKLNEPGNSISQQAQTAPASASPSNAVASTSVTSVAPAARVAVASAKLIDSDAYKKLRAALEAKDQTAAGLALEDMIAFVKAHPELVDDYVAALRSEKNEYVLRYLALALAECEPVLRDEKIVRAAIDLAKDTSFQQRQHIMLHLMSSFPEMRDDVHQTVLQLSRQDPDSQVKASAVAVMADWLQTFHGETVAKLVGELEQVFKTAVDEDVRAFTYQLAALHKDKLPLSFQSALVERLGKETDWTGRNLIITALTAASAEMRAPVLAQVQSTFNNEQDLENKRHLLAQLVVLEQEHAVDILQKNITDNSSLAEDAKTYLAMLSSGHVDPDTIFGQKAILDQQRHPAPETKH